MLFPVFRKRSFGMKIRKIKMVSCIKKRIVRSPRLHGY